MPAHGRPCSRPSADSVNDDGRIDQDHDPSGDGRAHHHREVRLEGHRDEAERVLPARLRRVREVLEDAHLRQSEARRPLVHRARGQRQHDPHRGLQVDGRHDGADRSLRVGRIAPCGRTPRDDQGVRLDATSAEPGSPPISTARASMPERTGRQSRREARSPSLPPATTWVQFRAVDKAGNASAWASTVPDDPSSTAMIDKVPRPCRGSPPAPVRGRRPRRWPSRRPSCRPTPAARASAPISSAPASTTERGRHPQRQLDDDLGRGQDRGRVPQ